LREAAEVLNLSVDAVRKRVKRGTLESERGPDGKVYVFIDADQESGAPRSHDTDRLIATLQEQLALEREAHAEARRLLAAALERIPSQIEAPRGEESSPYDERESPKTPSEPVYRDRPFTDEERAQEAAQPRSWWRRMFGV